MLFSNLYLIWLGYYYFVLNYNDGFIMYNDICYVWMQSIKKSECPKELEPADRRSSVNVNLIRRNEKYPVSFLFEFFGLSLSNLFWDQDELSWICLLTMELLKFHILKCNQVFCLCIITYIWKNHICPMY